MRQSPEQKILDLIFTYPTGKLSFRDIARQTNLSVATVAKYAKVLEKEEVVLLEKRPNAIYVEGNLSDRFRQMKRTANFRKLYEAGLVTFLEDKLRPESVVLFGSYSRGEDTEESDIDLAVIGGRSSEPDCSFFEKILGRKISIMSVDLGKAMSEFKSALVNGIVLQGYLFINELEDETIRKNGKAAKRPSRSRARARPA